MLEAAFTRWLEFYIIFKFEHGVRVDCVSCFSRIAVFFFCLLILFPCSKGVAGMQKIVIKCGGEIQNAEIFVWKFPSEARINVPPGVGFRAVLVLCPGQNASSENLVQQADWRDFASRERLALVGLRFVSSDEHLKNGLGYFVASRGSGELLEKGLESAGLGRVPILLYGFSGGAHFAITFAEWRPERVAAFCAYSFAWWKMPPENLAVPAVIVCGQADGERYGATLGYFQAGRRQAKPWVWVSLEGLAHEPSTKLDAFVRKYFSAVLKSREGNRGGPIYVDNMTGKVVSDVRAKDVGVSVLPKASLLPEWQRVHHP